MPPDRTPQRRLGRGLDALFNPSKPAEGTAAAVAATREIPLASISPNPYQPRRTFSDSNLAELRESLRTNGLLQPVSVRPAGNGFQLIAGERRLRAAQSLEWPTITATVREVDDRTLLALALVENLQRSDLNPIEEAEGYKRLAGEFGLSQQDVAIVVGKQRSTVANMLRLLDLPERVKDLVRTGELAMGHVRPLLGVGNTARIIDLAEEIRSKGMTARAAEQKARVARPAKPGSKRKSFDSRPKGTSAEAKLIEDRLRRHLQTDVKVTADAKGRGNLTVQFYSPEDLDRVLERMGIADL